MNQGAQDIGAKAGASQTNEHQLLILNQALLESVVKGDWLTYSNYCSQDLTCFEAETNGVLAEGLAFHHFYFQLSPADPSSPSSPMQVSMARPHIRWISQDAAILSYTRLTQKTANGAAVTASCCETRVWQRIDGTWKHVHVHRS
ncbi:MAG: nuclear transport factor 2 family protein [Cyanobacteria bacterium]|nr:nuclear transport factor 2 family protein [Cyanobacteriota bacterium]